MKTLREYINKAKEDGVAVGHFNISNLEALHGIFNAAKELDLPVIIGVSEGERKFVGVREAAALVQSLRDEHDYPVFLNADHTYSYEGVVEAIDAGFDSVIFDGVKLSQEENIEMTKKCVEYARNCGRDVLVEAEMGNIGQSSKVLDEIPEGVATDEAFMTSVEDAKAFVEATGVDMLAPAVGNMHGMVKGSHNPRIDEQRVKDIAEATGAPLVLHGGSGLVDEDFTMAIKAGVACVHINTEIRIAYKEALVSSLAENPDEIAPYRILKPAVEAVQATVSARLRLFTHQS